MYDDSELRKCYPVQINYNGTPCLGIPIASASRKYFFAKLAEFKSYSGWVVKDGQVSEWKVQGLCELGDDNYFYGPYLEGRVFDEFYSETGADWQDHLLSLLEAYSLLSSQVREKMVLYPMSVLRLDEGGYLFLPPRLFTEVIALSPEDIQQRQRTLLNHPDLTGEESVSYFAAVFAYKKIFGEIPFAGDAEDELKFRIRNEKLVPLEYRLPGIKKEVSQFLQDALRQRNQAAPSPEDWLSRLRDWRENGLFREITSEEKALLNEKAAQKQVSLEKRYHFFRFLHVHRTKIITLSLVSVIILFIVGSIVYNAHFRPRLTVNLEPLELVETYYRSITTIDFPTLDDCVLRGVAKQDVNEVMNLFVISRQQMALMDEAAFYPADQWVEEGKPPVEAELHLYGIANLVIREMAGGVEPVYTAVYEKWRTEVSGDGAEMHNPVVEYFGSAIVDHLYLKRDRGGWIIYKLERISEEEIDFSPGDDEQT